MRAERGDDDAGHVSSCATCQERAAAYARLRGIVAGVGEPDEALPADWQAKVWALIERRKRPLRSRHWLVPGLIGLAGAAALLWLVVFRPATPLEPAESAAFVLAVRAERGQATPDRPIVRGEARPGDRLIIQVAAPPDRLLELRVYRDGRLVFACSDRSPCQRRPEGLFAELTMRSAGHWRVLTALAPGPLPETTGSYDGDLADLYRMGASVRERDLGDVY